VGKAQVLQKSKWTKPFGNISKSGSAIFQPSYNTATNQMGSGFTYDSNGNLKSDSVHKLHLGCRKQGGFY
jgi:hypothetical protein